MAGCSKKQYAIMMSAGPEGEQLASKMGGMSQEEFDKAFSELLDSSGSTEGSEKITYSRDEDEDYVEFDADSEDDYEDEAKYMDSVAEDRKYEQDRVVDIIESSNYFKDGKITAEDYEKLYAEIKDEVNPEYDDIDDIIEDYMESKGYQYIQPDTKEVVDTKETVGAKESRDSLLSELTSGYQEDAIENALEIADSREEAVQMAVENYRETIKKLGLDASKGFKKYGDDTHVADVVGRIWDAEHSGDTKNDIKESTEDVDKSNPDEEPKTGHYHFQIHTPIIDTDGRHGTYEKGVNSRGVNIKASSIEDALNQLENKYKDGVNISVITHPDGKKEDLREYDSDSRTINDVRNRIKASSTDDSEKLHQDFTNRVGRFIDSDGSDEELDSMISDLRKNMSDEDIIKKLATMFKGTIK